MNESIATAGRDERNILNLNDLEKQISAPPVEESVLPPDRASDPSPPPNGGLRAWSQVLAGHLVRDHLSIKDAQYANDHIDQLNNMGLRRDIRRIPAVLYRHSASPTFIHLLAGFHPDLPFALAERRLRPRRRRRLQSARRSSRLLPHRAWLLPDLPLRRRLLAYPPRSRNLCGYRPGNSLHAQHRNHWQLLQHA